METTKIKAAVFFGGRSVEHEVSIITGLQALHALDKNKYAPVPVYISKEGRWYSGEALTELSAYRDLPQLLSRAIPVRLSLNYGDCLLTEDREVTGGLFRKAAPFCQRLDVALLGNHGTTVEDGLLQGILDSAGLPYTSPGVLGSAMGMDKIVTKAVLKEAGLPVVDYFAFTAGQWLEDENAVLDAIEQKPGYPLVVKPANLGSSIGISRVENREALRDKIELALSFSRRILVEHAVEPLREINCAVLGDADEQTLSLLEEPLNATEILTFDQKYLSAASSKGMSGAKRRIPAELPETQAALIRSLAQQAFRAMDCRGVCRVDFLLEGDQVYVNELNTIPGSLSFYLFEPTGLTFGQLLERLLQIALKAKRDTDRLTRVYQSNILAQGGFKGKK